MNIAIADDRADDLQAAEDSVLRYFSTHHPEVIRWTSPCAISFSWISMRTIC